MEILAGLSLCLLKLAANLCNTIWSYDDSIRELNNKAGILRQMIMDSLDEDVQRRSTTWCTEADDLVNKVRGRIWTHSSCLETEGLPTTCCGKIWNPCTRYQLSEQIKECLRRFDDLRKELEYHVNLEEKRKEQRAQLRLVSQPLGDQPVICYERQSVPDDIVGKEMVNLLDDVIQELLNGDGRKWVGVSGTGGLGKTTLAKLVNNDSRVQDCFGENIAWITVGKESISNFKQVKQQLQSKVPALKLSSMDVDSMKTALENAVHGKHVLFILDDVWEVGSTLDLLNVIKKPSKVLITTRNKDIIDAKHGKALEAHFLTDEGSIELFKKKAFGDELPQNNMVMQFAEKMAKACDGLPLLIELTGSCMSQYKGYGEHIWEKKMKDFQNRGSHYETKVVLKKMKLSFHELKHVGGLFDGVKMQECFLYMAAFPEGFAIKIDSLEKCWRGEDLVGNNSLYETMDILRCLEGRSLLQIDDSKSSYHWIIKVHDVVRQLCIEICQERERRCLFGHDVEDTGEKEGCFSKGNKFRKVSLTGSDKRIPAGMHVTDVLLLDGNTSFENLDKQLLKRLTELKVLSLQNTHITVLPQSISTLKNLHTLDLKGTKLSEIPKSIFTMRQLRYLNITPGVGSAFYMDDSQAQALKNLSQLEDLTWRFDTKVSCIDFSSLASLHNMRILALYCMNRESLLKFSRGLGMLKDLQVLVLEGGRLDITSISESNLTNLRTCHLSDIVEGDWGILVRNSHRLNELQVNYFVKNAAERVQETGGKDLTCLEGCTEIEVIRILDSVDFFTLPSLPKLKRLELRVTNPPARRAPSASFPWLEGLWLSTAGGGTWKHLPSFVTSLAAGLKLLRIKGHVERLVPDDASHDAWSSSGLDKLILGDSEKAYPDEFFEPGGYDIKTLVFVPGRRWQHLPKSITKLTRLTFLQIGIFPHDELVNGKNKMETLFGGGAEDDGLMSGLVELRKFAIYGWEGLTQLPRSVARLPQLEEILLSHCPNLEELISAEDDEEKESLFPKLNYLRLRQCGCLIMPGWLENRSEVNIHRVE